MNLPAPVELKLTMKPGGVIEVSGPIADKFLCYAMLEGARDAIKDYNDKKQSESLITPARAIVPMNGR